MSLAITTASLMSVASISPLVLAFTPMQRRQFMVVKNSNYVSYIQPRDRREPVCVESRVTFYNPFTATAKRLPKKLVVSLNDVQVRDRHGLELLFNSALKARLIEPKKAMSHGVDDKEVKEEIRDVLLQELTESIEQLSIYDVIKGKSIIRQQVQERVSRQLRKIGYEAEEAAFPEYMTAGDTYLFTEERKEALNKAYREGYNKGYKVGNR